MVGLQQVLIGLGTTVAVVLGLSSGARVIAQQTADTITPPARQSPPPPVAVAPPAVPAVANSLAPMTLAVTTRWEQPGQAALVTRQTVLRTVDRALIVIDGTQSEWLFERNPIDHRRVSGYLVDHKLRRILIHQESDLRNAQQLRGWMDVLTLRFDPETLKALTVTHDTQMGNGIAFAKYVAAKPALPGVLEVWWSADRLLPRRVTVREGNATITTQVESFADGVDQSQLATPATRFPSYRVLDVTDARDPS
jgi:hypothetical protein